MTEFSINGREVIMTRERGRGAKGMYRVQAPFCNVDARRLCEEEGKRRFNELVQRAIAEAMGPAKTFKKLRSKA